MVAATAGTLAFILAVVRDMDNSFRGVRTVSYGAMTAAAAAYRRSSRATGASRTVQSAMCVGVFSSSTVCSSLRASSVRP